MIRRFFGVLLTTAMLMGATPSFADDRPAPTREETMAYVAEKLADLAVTNRAFMSANDSSSIMEQLTNALDTVNAIRGFLVGNQWIQVGGFSIGMPAGVSIDFVFPPGSG